MKTLFAGPSLYGEIVGGRIASAPDIVCRGPAAQGDIAAAVLDGAAAIGLVDGLYEDVAAPWHKEILFALSEGVAVYGGGSLGALRAAECAHFGMIGVGEIFDRYMSGDLVDDSAVAQLHAPAELDYLPLTEALVNVEATIRRLAVLALIDPQLAAALAASARGVFFKRLTFQAVVERAGVAPSLIALLVEHRVDRKREDALALVAQLAARAGASAAPPAWALAQPPAWRRQFERLMTLRRVKAEI
jgi:hypothetical protein